MVVVGERRGEWMVNNKEHHHDQAVTVAYHGEHFYEEAPHAHYSMMSPLHMAVSDEAHSHRATSFPCSPARGAAEGTSSHGEAVSTAVIRAQDIQSKLKTEFPSFVKSLVRSHVASCFWMGLPVAFCKRHLPDKDTTITLEDESGKEYKTKYIACKTGLSAGWRQFSAVHKLQEGDVVVFQLVEPTKFKVYITRASKVRELDGAFLNLGTFTKQKVGGRTSTNNDVVSSNSSKRKHGKSVPQDVPTKKKAVVSRMGPKSNRGQSTEPSDSSSDEALSEVLEGFKMLQFKDIKGLQNFNIIVDGMLIDAELSSEVRNKYFRLCHSQQAFLHENLIRGMNYKLIAGIISETVNIADAIKVSVVSTPRVGFANWDKTLRSFELLGMNVAFLRARLRRLVSLAYESEDASEARRYLAYRGENSRADEELKNMETKLKELKGACNDFGAYLESLKCKAESYQHQFQKEVAAPW